MLVPMILPLDDRHADNAIVDLCQRLVKPFVGAFLHHLVDIDHLKVIKLDIQLRHIRICLFHKYECRNILPESDAAAPIPVFGCPIPTVSPALMPNPNLDQTVRRIEISLDHLQISGHITFDRRALTIALLGLVQCDRRLIIIDLQSQIGRIECNPR